VLRCNSNFHFEIVLSVVCFPRISAQGLLVSKMLPAVQRYQEKPQDEQYQIRRSMRNFCKWYKYVSQVVRMFDKELHREFVYCAFLVGLLPVQVVAMENIAELLTLEMYKLEKTFDGDISLGDEGGTYEQAKPKRGSKPEARWKPSTLWTKPACRRLKQHWKRL